MIQWGWASRRMEDVRGVVRNAPGAARLPVQYEISILTTAEEVQQIAGRCGALLEQPLEQNVFYEPWMLATALETLPSSGIHIVVISECRGGEVTGIFPFQLSHRLRGLPLRVLKSWQHPYCFLCTPLLLAPQARQTLRGCFDWLESRHAPARIVELELYAADGPFDALLQTELAERPRWRSHWYRCERPMFRPAQAPGISGRHLKELRRRSRRLAEAGELAYRVLAPGENVEPWLARFLDLEASGWKGRQRTALACDRGSREFFERAARAAAARGRLQMLSLELDGAPIVMMCSFLAGEGAFGFKMAYDERYAKYSPGVLLQLFNMQHLGEYWPRTQWLDSCADTQHSLLNRLWTQRRCLGGRVMTSRHIPAALIGNWPHLARMRRLLKGRRRRAPDYLPIE